MPSIWSVICTRQPSAEQRSLCAKDREAENYKVIDLEKGETKTVDIKGVNYAGTDLSSVDSKVSDVTIDGKDKKETIEKTSAQRVQPLLFLTDRKWI